MGKMPFTFDLSNDFLVSQMEGRNKSLQFEYLRHDLIVSAGLHQDAVDEQRHRGEAVLGPLPALVKAHPAGFTQHFHHKHQHPLQISNAHRLKDPVASKAFFLFLFSTRGRTRMSGSSLQMGLWVSLQLVPKALSKYSEIGPV